MHKPHDNLDDRVNAAIAQSEADGGVWFNKLPIGSTLQIKTANRLYLLARERTGCQCGAGFDFSCHCLFSQWFILGHPTYCHKWTACRVAGSTFGGSMLKAGFVGVGMHLEFTTAEHGTITTSVIERVRVL